MKKLYIKAVLLIYIIVGGYSYAGTYEGLMRPHFWNSSLYITPLKYTATDKPNCATRSLLRLQEMDINSEIFQLKYSMILSHWLAGKPLQFIGSGDCTSEGDETIRHIIPLQ